MLPAISPFVLQRNGFADSTQVRFVVADSTEHTDWNDTTTIQQTFQVIDHLFEWRRLVKQNEILAVGKDRQRLLGGRTKSRPCAAASPDRGGERRAIVLASKNGEPGRS